MARTRTTANPPADDINAELAANAADAAASFTGEVTELGPVEITLPPELASRFVTEAVEPDVDKAYVVRANAHAIAGAAEQIAQLPDSRYKSLALTALEEAQMWASKAVFS